LLPNVPKTTLLGLRAYVAQAGCGRGSRRVTSFEADGNTCEAVMSYVTRNLVAGESLVYETGVHWCVLFWPLVIAAVIGAGAIACFLQKDSNFLYAGAALLVVAVGVMAAAMTRRNATEIAVTNRRVFVKTGWARRRSFEIMLPKVESIGIKEPLLGRILGYGTVVIRGTGGTPEPFDKIAHPSEFRRHVQEQADRSRA
jgi:uncharacterized membrane protein YdbT with pleckstrin-like domain